MRAELLPALPPGRAPSRADRYVDQSCRLPLHKNGHIGGLTQLPPVAKAVGFGEGRPGYRWRERTFRYFLRSPSVSIGEEARSSDRPLALSLAQFSNNASKSARLLP